MRTRANDRVNSRTGLDLESLSMLQTTKKTEIVQQLNKDKDFRRDLRGEGRSGPSTVVGHELTKQSADRGYQLVLSLLVLSLANAKGGS